MKKIYKYVLKEIDTQSIDLHQFSTILKVDKQGDQLCMWVEGNTQRPLVPHTFRIFGTGHDILEDEHLTFLNTVVMRHFVWHIYLKHN